MSRSESNVARPGNRAFGWMILAAFLCGCVATPPARCAGIYDVRDFGARGDGAAKDTAALQAAIDAAHSAGGGEVRIPAGRYVTGSLFLKRTLLEQSL